MFESLDEEMKRQENVADSKGRWLRHAGVLVVTLGVFAALYVGMLFFE